MPKLPLTSGSAVARTTAPLPQPTVPQQRETTPEQLPTAAAGQQGTPKTSSLPRQKRRGDLPPSPNVAIVSPMPALQQQQQQRPPRDGGLHGGDEEKKSSREESEDPLQGIAPMAPLGHFRGSLRGPERSGGQEITASTALLTGKSYFFYSCKLAQMFSWNLCSFRNNVGQSVVANLADIQNQSTPPPTTAPPPSKPDSD